MNVFSPAFIKASTSFLIKIESPFVFVVVVVVRPFSLSLSRALGMRDGAAANIIAARESKPPI